MVVKWKSPLGTLTNQGCSATVLEPQYLHHGIVLDEDTRHEYPIFYFDLPRWQRGTLWLVGVACVALSTQKQDGFITLFP